ncbi:MAG: single-stranded DNA-binding protein [Methylococcales bacterium]
MINALTTGTLIRDPVTRTARNGNPYTHFLLTVPVGDGETTLATGIAFGDPAEKIAKFKRGDAIAVVGTMKPSIWPDKTTGEIRHGLNIVVQACLSPYDVRRRRGDNAGFAEDCSDFDDDELPFD